MYVCMYVCMCVYACMHACMYVGMHACPCVIVHMFVYYMYTQIELCIYMQFHNMHGYICTYIIHMYIDACMYVCMHACTHVCRYIYIYVYVFLYIYIYMYMANPPGSTCVGPRVRAAGLPGPRVRA